LGGPKKALFVKKKGGKDVGGGRPPFHRTKNYATHWGNRGWGKGRATPPKREVKLSDSAGGRVLIVDGSDVGGGGTKKRLVREPLKPKKKQRGGGKDGIQGKMP